MWNDAYFSEHKKYYLDILSYYMNECKNNCFETFVIIDDQKIKKHLFLAKLHLSWLYWKIIRPIGKHCIVLPYRRFKEFIRRKNDKNI